MSHHVTAYRITAAKVLATPLKRTTIAPMPDHDASLLNDEPPLHSQTADSNAAPHIYAQLTPDVVLDALASVGLMGDGRLTALA